MCYKFYFRPSTFLTNTETYEKALNSAEAKTEHHFLMRENGFGLDEKILDAIKPETDAVFLCNPNNPTGKTAENGLMEAVLKRCSKFGGRLFLDECFNDWLDNPGGFSLADKIEKSKNLMIIKAFTKNYGLAGLRLGYGICSDEKLLSSMSCFTPPWNVSTPAQIAGIAALSDQGHFEKAKKTVKEEKPRMVKALAEFGFGVYGGDANFIFFRAEKNLREKLLARGILIRGCGNFAGLDESYFRICVKTRKENDTLIEEIRRVLFNG